MSSHSRVRVLVAARLVTGLAVAVILVISGAPWWLWALVGAVFVIWVLRALAREHPGSLAVRNNLARAYQSAGHLDKAKTKVSRVTRSCRRNAEVDEST